MVWIGAPSGLFRFRDNRWESVGAVGAVSKLYEDRQGNLLIGSARRGALALAPGTDDFRELGSTRAVNSFSEDPSGGLWANDGEKGYRLLRGPTASPISLAGLKGVQGYRLIHDGDGNMWIGTSFEGLIRVHGDSADAPPLVERFMTTEGLSHNLIRALLQDRDGNIWIGTVAGLSRVVEVGLLVDPRPDRYRQRQFSFGGQGWKRLGGHDRRPRPLRRGPAARLSRR